MAHFMKPGEDTSIVDKGLKNKWRWAWLDEIGLDGKPFSSWCKKLREPGVLFCTLCHKKFRYASSGKKVIPRHEQDPEHRVAAARAATHATLMPGETNTAVPAASIDRAGDLNTRVCAFIDEPDLSDKPLVYLCKNVAEDKMTKSNQHSSCLNTQDKTLSFNIDEASHTNMDEVEHRVCGTDLVTGPPNHDPKDPDFAPSPCLASHAAQSSATPSTETTEDNTEDQERDGSRLRTSSYIEKEKEKCSGQKVAFGADHAQMLGEILAYCQVMYRAMQKLDEKFESLKAKVMHIEPVQRFQKATSNTVLPLSSSSMDIPVRVDTCPAPDLPTMSMPEIGHVFSLSPSAGLPVKKLPSQSPAAAPRVCSPTGLPILGNAVTSSAAAPAYASHVMPIEGEEDTDVEESEQRVATRRKSRSKKATATLRWLGSRRRGVRISQAKLKQVQRMTKPSKAVRFLFRSIFSLEELQCSNLKGNPVRGLRKLDPNKIAAIREWMARRFPDCDLREKGGIDWKKCRCVMNSTTRYLRLMAKRRKLKMENISKVSVCQDIEDSQSHPEQYPVMDESTEPCEADNQNHCAKGFYKAATDKLVEPCAAEVDVELSVSEEEDDALLIKRLKTEEEGGTISCQNMFKMNKPCKKGI
ncbi:uncharacterized protein LOC134447504 isoform X2 [Engraulis encrasicolus]|uniref:uncharacterized protein LOC134447504 isoform X2 n=1 Tax=Engraulis encrasicolus TaxID=184585 RepID=UPI002FCFDDD0